VIVQAGGHPSVHLSSDELEESFLREASEQQLAWVAPIEPVINSQIDASIPHFERAIEIWPENPIFHYNLGTAFLRSGRYAAALAELRIAGGDELWRRMDPSVGAALAARGLNERDFRASIAQWIAENASKIEGRAP